MLYDNRRHHEFSITFIIIHEEEHLYMGNKTWQIGVIGVGAIADFHIEAIKEIPNAALAGVSSRTEARAKETGEREQCFWTTNYEELLQKPEIDLICLTTSSGSHYEIGKKVLEAGKHLLVEKPLCMLPEEADGMIAIAEGNNVQLGT